MTICSQLEHSHKKVVGKDWQQGDQSMPCEAPPKEMD